MSLTFTEPPPTPPEPPTEDVPRVIDPGTAGADRRFRRIATANGIGVLVLTGSIGVLLFLSLIPAVKHYGLHFFTTSGFQPTEDVFGIASAILGTVIVAVIAMFFAFPLSMATALYITEFAPRWGRTTLILLIDLMAAVPSLIFGAWGIAAVDPQAANIDRWFSTWLGWIPIFKVPAADPRAVPLYISAFTQTPLITGMIVAMMVVPLTTSVMRNVFSQTPVGEREAALALGATRWGMIRAVVLPFGRGGIIGGTMLGLGRALGETVAVLLILAPLYNFHVRIAAFGGITISGLIANNFGEAPAGAQRYGLLGAGFVLFVMTLLVNTVAASIVARSRSGAGLD